MPPDVGYADTSSDIVKPMIKMNAEISGQPQEMATVRRCSSPGRRS